MGSETIFFAGSEDDKALRNYAETIGLKLLHPMARKMTPTENEKSLNDLAQGGYFSFLPVEKLHPYNETEDVLCDVIDPLIFYMRPYPQPPYLISGRIRWNNDVKELAKQTKPYYSKLRKWIQSKWKKYEYKSFIGPHAEMLVAEENAILSYMPPGFYIKRVELP